MNTLFIGRRIIRLKSVASTNNFAASLPLAEAPEGTVVIANEQTGGRGQFGRIWHAESGLNLTLTVVLRPNFLSLNKGFYLNKAMAIAVAKTIKSLIPEAKTKIKWPNDIFVNDNKVAGILTENSIRGGHFVSYLAGIGINVNQLTFPEAAGNPISLKQFAGIEFDIEDVFKRLCKEIEVIYLQIKRNAYDDVALEYEKWLWKKDELINFEFEQTLYSGIIKSVNHSGELIIEALKLGVISFKHGSIKIIQD